MLYPNLLKPLLFSMDPEFAHDLGTKALQITGNLRPIRSFLKKSLQSKKIRLKFSA